MAGRNWRQTAKDRTTWKSCAVATSQQHWDLHTESPSDLNEFLRSILQNVACKNAWCTPVLAYWKTQKKKMVKCKFYVTPLFGLQNRSDFLYLALSHWNAATATRRVIHQSIGWVHQSGPFILNYDPSPPSHSRIISLQVVEWSFFFDGYHLAMHDVYHLSAGRSFCHGDFTFWYSHDDVPHTSHSTERLSVSVTTNTSPYFSLPLSETKLSHLYVTDYCTVILKRWTPIPLVRCFKDIDWYCFEFVQTGNPLASHFPLTVAVHITSSASRCNYRLLPNRRRLLSWHAGTLHHPLFALTNFKAHFLLPPCAELFQHLISRTLLSMRAV